MHVIVRWNALLLHARQSARRGVKVVAVCGLVAGSSAICRTAYAAANGAELIDAHVLTELESRATAANAREQAFLYADLADKMSVLAGRQIANGDVEEAEATLQRMEACTAKMEINLQQSRSLKKTELLLHTTNRRLTDLVRAAGMDMKPHVQSALKRLNTAQNSLLALIFSK